MVALGEMSPYLPHKKSFVGYAMGFVEPAFSDALGWNYIMKYLIPTPNSNTTSAGAVIQYWTRHIHIAVWMGEFFPNLTTHLTA